MRVFRRQRLPSIYISIHVSATLSRRTHSCLGDVDGVYLCVLFGDGVAAPLLPHQRALRRPSVSTRRPRDARRTQKRLGACAYLQGGLEVPR